MKTPAGVIARSLAQDDEHFATKQIPMICQLGEKTSMAARRCFQRGVRQFRGGTEERVDDGGEIGGLGPDEDLDGLGERVEKAREARHEGLLLGEGAKGERHRSSPTHQGQTINPEVDDPVRPDAHQRESQRRWQGAGGAGKGGRGGHPVGGGHEPVRGTVMAPGGPHPPVGGDTFEAAQRQQDGESTEGNGDHGEDGRGHDVARGAVAGPQDHPGHSQDGELMGGQVGEQPVLALDIGGNAHPTPVPGRVMLSTGHSATPAASALTPL